MRRFCTGVGIAAVALSGCATSNQKVVVDNPVDQMIVAYAEEATKSLRKMAEADGRVKMVTVIPRQEQNTMPASKDGKKAIPGTAPASKRNLVEVIESNSSAAIGTGVLHDARTPEDTGATVGGVISIAPEGLDKRVSMVMTADVEEIVATICSETGWRYRSAEGVKISPVVVSLGAENRSAYQVLLDVGNMMGQAADVVINIDERTVRVRYPFKK